MVEFSSRFFGKVLNYGPGTLHLANMNDYRPTVTHAKNVQMKDAQLAIAIDITNLSMQSLVKLLKSRLILNRNIN